MTVQGRDRAGTLTAYLERLVPRRLVVWATWMLLLIIIGCGLWFAGKIVGVLSIVVVPIMVAMLFVALLEPVKRALLRLHLPNGLAAIGAVLLLAAVMSALGKLVQVKITDHFSNLVREFSRSIGQLHDQIVNGPLPITQNMLDRWGKQIQHAVQPGGQSGPGTLIDITQTTMDVLAAVVLGLFVTIFLLYDGERIWAWFRGLFPPSAAGRLDEAGRAAWTTLTGFIQGTFIIACIHSVVIGTALWLLGVEIIIPLVFLVFLGSFIPLVGAVIAGFIAVLITFGTQGLGPALILLIVLVIENEIEAHILQPFVVGRYVRLHPLAIVLALTIGSFLFGAAGALFSVPLTGMARSVWGPLNGRPSVVPVGQPSRLTRLWRRIKRR